MYWYAGKTSSISSPSKSQRGFPCNPICHIYSSPPHPPTPSKHPRGPKPTPLFKQAFWIWIKHLNKKKEKKKKKRLRHADQCSEINRGQVLPLWPRDVALQILVNHFVQSRRPASASSGSSQLGSLSASQTLKEVFKCAPAAMRSLNDLFIC